MSFHRTRKMLGSGGHEIWVYKCAKITVNCGQSTSTEEFGLNSLVCRYLSKAEDHVIYNLKNVQGHLFNYLIKHFVMETISYVVQIFLICFHITISAIHANHCHDQVRLVLSYSFRLSTTSAAHVT